MQPRRLRLTVRSRMLIIMTWLYVIIFAAGFIWFYNVGSRLAAGKLATDQVEGAITALQSEIIAVAVPLFLISYVILMVLVFAITGAVTKPIRTLARYADNIAKGDYTRIEIPKRITEDEIDVFADVFQKMVDQVHTREESLKRQVVEMQIIIDEAKKKKQVDEIVESEMFVSLKEKAQQMRERKTGTKVKSSDTSLK